MKEPVWLKIHEVIAFHAEQIREHGGLYGVRDENLLGSALSRPKHLFAYESPTLFDLAASYAYGIIKNHPFADGNKRVGRIFFLLVCFLS